jgi:hypothetical protein
MKLVSVQELLNLSSRFDVFAKSAEVSRRLLLAGAVPPLPVCGGELLWGFAVLRACVAEGIETVFCIDGDWSGSAKLLIALELESRTGSYSLEEQAAIAELANELGIVEDSEEVSKAVSGNSGFFPKIGHYMGLPGHLRTYVGSGRLDLKTAVRVAGLPEPLCRSACEREAFSHSELRIFLGLLYEIGMRDSMDAPQMTALGDRLLRSSDPMTSLNQLRNPGLTELEQRFRRVCQKYLTGSGVTLAPPKYFEGDTYLVTFPFADRGELSRRTETLRRLEEASDELEDLL